MPELIEVEYYRRALDPVVGQKLCSVTVTPQAFIRPPGTSVDAFSHLLGSVLTRTRRHGKLLILELTGEDGETGEVGLRFGMTGRLLIDDESPIDQLEYSSSRNDPAWDRAILQFDARVAIRDQRRLGSIEVAPDESGLGPNAETLDRAVLGAIVARRRKSIKAVLLDQSLVAGLGNLLCDEVLWRCSIGPARPAQDLGDGELIRLGVELPRCIEQLAERGGSHTGDSFALRTQGAQCTRCGAAMEHCTVATRSTWWCPGHQR